MNCRECLEALSTGSLRDLTVDSAVSRHAAICPDCGPLLTQLRDREYQAASILNNLPPISDPIRVAETAGNLARRRRMGGVVVTIASIALALSIWFAADTLIPDVFDGGHGVAGLQTETIPLACLSPQQAGDVINPYVRGHGRIYYVAPGVAAITVRASPSELYQIKDVLKNFDNPLATICRASTKSTLDALQKQLQNGADLEQVHRALEEQLRENAPVLAGERASTPKKKTP